MFSEIFILLRNENCQSFFYGIEHIKWTHCVV